MKTIESSVKGEMKVLHREHPFLYNFSKYIGKVLKWIGTFKEDYTRRRNISRDYEDEWKE